MNYHISKILKALKVDIKTAQSGTLLVRSPIDGMEMARVVEDKKTSLLRKIALADQAFQTWRNVPAPKRGELIRIFGEELRAHKEVLAELVSIEAGKILEEGRGEVQEMIDICDFACGLSRQLYGLTIASERPGHRMMETWHPLGVVAVISAFNFPVAVWAWNFALAIVCGNAVLWKPSEKTPVTSLACQKIFEMAVRKFSGEVPKGLSDLVIGGRDMGEMLVDDPRIALVSATGSCRMGREVGPRIAKRFGRSLLELGGNNAMIVCPSADLELAVRAITFSAAGTAGQRCTSLRRLFVHESVVGRLLPRLKKIYANLKVGNPLIKGTLVGPLIDAQAYEAMRQALQKAKEAGGKISGGDRVKVQGLNGFYVRPAIVELKDQAEVMKEETFAPILYVVPYKKFQDAIDWQNDVPQGLSSCIFTNDVREAEYFLSASGSDCGIANVNIGPSGAEIGGAFGGEKETGGGRESGSDAWRAYMRRATNTINFSGHLPLAQGINFDVK